MAFLGVACYDKSTFCSTYQTSSEYCNSRYSLLVNNTYLPVPDACQLSCNKCVNANRLSELPAISALRENEAGTVIAGELTPENTTTTTTIIAANMIFSRIEKCFDKRNDCLLQKQYGFCNIFNEKYPYDCTQTCHPDCASDS